MKKKIQQGKDRGMPPTQERFETKPRSVLMKERLVTILMKITFLLALMLWLTVTLPALAAERCRSLDDRSICIISIQRSAKNYWEYRAIVRIDGVERPLEVYNCRDRIRVQQDGTIVPFEPNGAGKFICSLFKE